MAWSTSDRRSRLPRDWRSRRARVLARDGHACRATDEATGQRCGRPATEVDHVVRGDNHDEANLQSLCHWHHARKTATEARAERRPDRTVARECEPHPFGYTDCPPA